jgi:hypothetical protein
VAGVTYTWTFPAGWTQTGGGTTNSITATVGSGAGNIQVTPSNGCGNGTARVLAVAPVMLPSQPGTISGSNSPCTGTSQVYSVTNVPGVSYAWTFPAGWTQTGGGSTNAVTVTVGSGSGNIQVIPSNACGAGTARVLAVTTLTGGVPAQPSAITGNVSVCQGSFQTYSVQNITGITYVWTFPSGWIQTGGGTTNSVTVTVGSGSGNVYVTPSNQCGNGSSSILAVIVNPLPVPVISGATTACTGSTGNIYSAPLGMPLYFWNVSQGGTITAGGTSSSNSVTVTWSSAGSQTVSLNYLNTNNCIATAPTVKEVTVVNPPQTTLTLGYANIPGGLTMCWNASQTITVAGSMTFTVQNGGSASFIAGQKVLLLPGVSVGPGGYLHASITTQCAYCPTAAKDASVASVADTVPNIDLPDVIVRPSFLLYPNPTNGLFMLELTGAEQTTEIEVNCYSVHGERIMKELLSGSMKYKFSLENRPSGIYIMRVQAGSYIETIKVVKL